MEVGVETGDPSIVQLVKRLPVANCEERFMNDPGHILTDLSGPISGFG